MMDFPIATRIPSFENSFHDSLGYYLVCYRIVSGVAILGLEQQWLKIACVVCSCFTSTATTLSGRLIQKLFSKDGIRVAIGKSIMHIT
jgi:hypothetical protein